MSLFYAWLRWTLRLTLAGVLVYAAVGKLRGGAGGDDLAATLFGGSVALVAALGVFELLLAGWLVSGVRPLLAAGVTALVLASFSGILAGEMRRDVPRPCGCLGAVAAKGPEAVRRGLRLGLLRNAALLAGVGGLALLEGRRRAESRPAAAFAAGRILS